MFTPLGVGVDVQLTHSTLFRAGARELHRRDENQRSYRKVSRVVMQCRADASLVDRVLFHARALRRGTIIGLLTDENIPKYALCLRQASVRIESLLKPITGEMPMPNSRLPSWCY